MALKKLPKNKGDLKFLNKETFEVECSYNECYTKFIEGNGTAVWTPKWNGYKPIKFTTYFHECPECGRRIQGTADKTKNWQSYESAICGNGPKITQSEMDKAIEEVSSFGKTMKEG